MNSLRSLLWSRWFQAMASQHWIWTQDGLHISPDVVGWFYSFSSKVKKTKQWTQGYQKGGPWAAQTSHPFGCSPLSSIIHRDSIGSWQTGKVFLQVSKNKSMPQKQKLSISKYKATTTSSGQLVTKKAYPRLVHFCEWRSWQSATEWNPGFSALLISICEPRTLDTAHHLLAKLFPEMDTIDRDWVYVILISI